MPNVRSRLARCAWILCALLGAPGAVASEPRAPVVTLPRLADGAPFELGSLAGRVVLVDFWASWCGPCRRSLPAYGALRAELAPRGFEVVAINLDEHAADARAFLERHPLAFVVVRDERGDSARAFGVRTMPSSYLVGCDGTIRARHAGFEASELPALRARIEALLEEARCDAPPA